MGLIEHTAPQQSEAWWDARRGVITGSRASDARNRTNGLTKQQNLFVQAIREGRSEAEAIAIAGYKKRPTAADIDAAIAGTLPLQWGEAAITYAMEVARGRCGGTVPVTSGFAATRIGHEEEPFAAIAWVAETGLEVKEVGFITTEDRMFGCSLDRRVKEDERRALEIKTMVSTTTLFKAIVDGDISEYRDQCLFAIWLLSLDEIDLCLWAPDLPKSLHIVTIKRDEEEIQKLEDDLMAFRELVTFYENKLRAKLGLEPATGAASVVSVIDGAPAAVPDEAKPALPPRPMPPRRPAPAALPAASATPFDFGALLPADIPF